MNSICKQNILLSPWDEILKNVSAYLLSFGYIATIYNSQLAFKIVSGNKKISIGLMVIHNKDYIFSWGNKIIAEDLRKYLG